MTPRKPKAKAKPKARRRWPRVKRTAVVVPPRHAPTAVPLVMYLDPGDLEFLRAVAEAPDHGGDVGSVLRDLIRQWRIDLLVEAADGGYAP